MAQAAATLTEYETVTGEMEIRHIPPHLLNRLELILDNKDEWKDLASIIPNPDSLDTLLFSINDIRVLEEDQLKRRISPTQSLLKYWGTFGRNRPKVNFLLELLNTCGLLRAARYVSLEMLGQDIPVAEPSVQVADCKPATSVPVMNHRIDNDHPDVPHYSYTVLERSTRGFCQAGVHNGGCLLGEGAFGEVFLAKMDNGNFVAVKKLKNSLDQQCITELQVLSRFEHPNLLPLLGYSVDGPSACLVFEYLSKGSLQQCLSEKVERLPWMKRLTIAFGSAKGINHLHTHENKPLVHRDIKSANILLDSNYNPKLGDFGLARLGSAGTTTALTIKTVNISGTSPYMSPEAFRGDVSSKIDVFSYGVVLLELLTGLPPFDASREDSDLLSHVQENCDDICKHLDPEAGQWDSKVAEELYQVSVKCTNNSKRERPTMVQVIPMLEALCISVT